MRIGVIASTSQPLDEPFAGGLEAHTSSLAGALRRRGHEVTVHAAEGEGKTGWRPVARSPLSLSERARDDASMTSEGFMRDHHAYLSLMVRLDEEGYDVVHNNCLHYLPVAMAGSVVTPMVTTLHTPPTPWLESAIEIDRWGRNIGWVSVSRANADAWSHMGLGPRVIHNGIDLDDWAPVAEPEAERAVWSGRIVPEKGPHLAAAAALQAGVPLDIAGPISSPDYYERHLEPLLGPDVRYVGHLGGARLRSLIANAAVCVVTPRWEEPFGLVVVEALACGTPVAAFARGALPELVTPDCAALAPADDVGELASAMRCSFGLDGSACRVRAEECFSLDRMVDEYVDFYEQSLSKEPT